MNLASYYSWIVFVHIIAAFAFVLSHGVSMFMSDQARRQPATPERVGALLDLSRSTLPIMYGSLVVLLIAGILAGMLGGHFGRLWIWVALAILILEIAAMYALAARYYARIRNAVGQASYLDGDGRPAFPAASPEELNALLASRRPDVIGVVGSLGLVVIIWLMVVKPF